MSCVLYHLAAQLAPCTRLPCLAIAGLQPSTVDGEAPSQDVSCTQQSLLLRLGADGCPCSVHTACVELLPVLK